jgi:hypothetical protein
LDSGCAAPDGALDGTVACVASASYSVALGS